MKFRLWLLTIFLFLGAHAANAQLFGYHGSVTFGSSSGLFFVQVSGPTFADCEAHRAAIKTFYSPPAYTVVAETPCVPIVIDPDKLRLPELMPEFKLPWPDPVCLSCPYLREGLVELIYPAEHKRVYELMDKFGIHEYNRALEELNMQFDLKGFTNEMHQLEQMEQKLQH